MQEIITYKADDGTLFDDEYECFYYEKKQEWKPFQETIIFVNSERKLVETNFHNVDNGTVFGMVLLSDESAEFIKSQSEAHCIGNPFDTYNQLTPVAGIYWYDDTRDRWLNVGNELEWFTTLKNSLTSLI